ncbi:hypothetical protein DL771_008240 [Monosporascus sp. 5C6A]|nr:hypothetical protein DL771_008240 [Monosporascus sp. 5C6A]
MNFSRRTSSTSWTTPWANRALVSIIEAKLMLKNDSYPLGHNIRMLGVCCDTVMVEDWEAEKWKGLQVVLERLEKALDSYGEGYVQAVENNNARDVGFLTSPATMFVPVSLVAGIISMGGGFAAGQNRFARANRGSRLMLFPVMVTVRSLPADQSRGAMPDESYALGGLGISVHERLCLVPQGGLRLRLGRLLLLLRLHEADGDDYAKKRRDAGVHHPLPGLVGVVGLPKEHVRHGNVRDIPAPLLLDLHSLAPFLVHALLRSPAAILVRFLSSASEAASARFSAVTSYLCSRTVLLYCVLDGLGMNRVGQIRDSPVSEHADALGQAIKIDIGHHERAGCFMRAIEFG